MKPQLQKGAGRPEPRGASVLADGVNFSVYSEPASQVFISLFDKAGRETERFALDGRDGAVHFGLIKGIGAGTRYGIRADGPYDPSKGLWFDPDKLLVDPYAYEIDQPFTQHDELKAPRGSGVDTAPYVPKSIVAAPVKNRAVPIEMPPRVIYELNVRGYSKLRPGLPAAERGRVTALTKSGFPEHFQALGVDTIELMPTAAWIDDWHLASLKLTNAWGYNPVTMMAPDPRLMPGGIADLRKVTDFYRKRGIAVILDVVFNHSGEGDTNGPVICYRGLDANTYYRHTFNSDGQRLLVNDAGTGNTLDCAHPEVQRLVLDAMRHWVEAGGVSGFRFDLATILGRTRTGFSPEAPLLAAIRSDPVLGKAILVAEPWDIGPGGYQLGGFGVPFLEWNDRYRDDVRAFWRGDAAAGDLASRLAGSSDLFQHGGRKPTASVNYIAAHDGFTLRDLVSYSSKHNLGNGENNRDGHSHNISWNCGYEGETENAEINDRRRADVRALLATLFVSRGTLMLGQGDEFWRSQGGNNNAYAQDNAVTWIDWGRADAELMNFVCALSAFRSAHPALTEQEFLTGQVINGVRDVVWLHPDQHELHPDNWQADLPTFGMLLDIDEDELVVWFNRAHERVSAYSALPRTGSTWHLGFSSGLDARFGTEPGNIILPPRSVTVLVPSDEGSFTFD